MVTLMIPTRMAFPRRVGAVVERNVKAMRVGPSYWVLLFSGIVEPLLYLLSIGVGVGALIERPMSYRGEAIRYAEFVGPGMLAFSAMSGALSEAIFTFFGKMKYARVFDLTFAATVRPSEIATAELVWAAVRAAFYSALFLGVMVALDLTTIGWALAALPATVLVGLSFSAMGLAVAALLRGWQDLELVTTAQVTLFLFSGTFSPVDQYPLVVQGLVELTPLYHAVELVRAMTLGAPHPGLLIHVGYLLAMVPLGLYFATRRIDRVLRH
ncbi:ABC transporter permease [Plantactinospora sp. KLBMP9567]|uniref:ABC transporter permease n=1 Tax=Plantactinospora sp. KLBMP9567 TaxID=3085900 RepID=UPI0029826779|nr:ABC transporter permease [Plantactinospora sp. KLBMP9567]MDW5329514.1 ABC transporter permease [Plantactinospora sp. KLBMP9567]